MKKLIFLYYKDSSIKYILIYLLIKARMISNEYSCTLHWECDGNHSPKVRITGDICGNGNRGLIKTSGPINAKEWLRLAVAPSALTRDPDDTSPLSFPLSPILKGVCITISYSDSSPYNYISRLGAR